MAPAYALHKELLCGPWLGRLWWLDVVAGAKYRLTRGQALPERLGSSFRVSGVSGLHLPRCLLAVGIVGRWLSGALAGGGSVVLQHQQVEGTELTHEVAVLAPGHPVLEADSQGRMPACLCPVFMRVSVLGCVLSIAVCEAESQNQQPRAGWPGRDSPSSWPPPPGTLPLAWCAPLGHRQSLLPHGIHSSHHVAHSPLPCAQALARGWSGSP